MRSGGRRAGRCFVRAGSVLAAAALSPVHRAFERTVIAASRYRVLHGIPVGLFRPRETEGIWGKVGEALDLLETTDPRRHRRVARDLKRIVVMRHTKPLLLERSATCVLGQELVETKSSALIAAVLVHEATHARVQAHGISYRPETRDRIEALCVREEIAFARRLPRDEYTSVDEFVRHLRRSIELDPKTRRQTGPRITG